MNKINFEVPNISCGHCVNTIQTEVKEIPGVIEVWADSEQKTVEVKYQDPASEKEIINLLEHINYPIK